MDKQTFRRQVNAWIADHAQEIAEELQGFSRIRSVSRADLAAEGAPFGPECRQMLSYALERAQALGFEVEDHEGYCGSVILGDKHNAIGIISHLDIVPEGDQWIYPPYGATRVGDFLVGRGVADNKGAAVMGLYLMRMFRDLNVPLLHGIRLIFGCAEETGMADMAYYVRHYPQPVVSLIPDSDFPVNYAQKGSVRGTLKIALGEQILEFEGGEVFNMVPPHATALLRDVEPFAAGEGVQVEREGEFVRVRATGVAAHAARPEKGLSAIERLAAALLQAGVLRGQSERAMRAVRTMCADIYASQAMIACEDPDTGRSTMVCGVAHTQEGAMSLSVDCRLSIAADVDRDSLTLQAYARDLGFEPCDFSTTQPVYIPKDDPLVQAMQAAYFEVTGDPTPPYTTGGGTYARVLANAITFGPAFPGEKRRLEGLPQTHGNGHAPDESLYIPDLLHAMEVYALAMRMLDVAVVREDT